jgi:hypothetical protein
MSRLSIYLVAFFAALLLAWLVFQFLFDLTK